jgi:phage terminase small subunit
MARGRVEQEDIGVGPAFSALTEKQKRFVLGLFDAPRTHGSLTFAAKQAGYQASSQASLHSIAHQLGSDPRIEAAIAEVSRQYLVTLGPRAVAAMRRVLDDDKHREFGRVVGLVMDRVSPTSSTHTVKVEHEVGPSMRAVANVTARILELAERAGVPAMIDVTPEKAQA